MADWMTPSISGAIRAGVLNAYLAPFRYFNAVGEIRHIRGMHAAQFVVHAGAMQRQSIPEVSPLRRTCKCFRLLP